jgi:homocysteine S-methyltransferase
MDLIKQISSKGLVLDGAMSTALEKQGLIQIQIYGQL